jgi:hypothetical protein
MTGDEATGLAMGLSSSGAAIAEAPRAGDKGIGDRNNGERLLPKAAPAAREAAVRARFRTASAVAALAEDVVVVLVAPVGMGTVEAETGAGDCLS